MRKSSVIGHTHITQSSKLFKSFTESNARPTGRTSCQSRYGALIRRFSPPLPRTLSARLILSLLRPSRQSDRLSAHGNLAKSTTRTHNPVSLTERISIPAVATGRPALPCQSWVPGAWFDGVDPLGNASRLRRSWSRSYGAEINELRSRYSRHLRR